MLNGKRIISLCTSRLNEMENSRFVAELNEELRARDTALFIYNVNTDLYWNDDNIRAEAAVFGLVDFDISDAVIIMYEKIKSNAVTERLIKEAQRKNVPVIIVDAEYEDCINICFDYKKGFETIVRHVIEKHGVKRPHFLGGLHDNVFSDERLEVFRKVIEENGIAFNDDMVSYGNFWAKPAREAAERIIASGDIPEAVICANDIMAINVCSVFQEHGYSIPEDIIVTGFDGIDEISMSIPKITSCYCGCAGLVPSICSALDGIFENGIHTGSYLVEPRLILYDSCGCERTENVTSLHRLRSFNDRFYRCQDDNMILSAVSESMQGSSDILDCACKLFTDVISDMTCIINKDCINCTQNYFAENGRMEFADDMFVFYESDHHVFRQRPFRRRDIIPDIDRAMSSGYPLIFNVVSFMNVPLGYICFYFNEYDIMDYCKIPQIVSAVGSGLGGYVSRQYQQYLMARVERMYKYDSLTGLFNRISFNHEFERRKRELDGKVVPITVILADLDGLKYINDNYGHGAGDNAIRTVAEALKSACPEDSLCVRFGGDEMLAVVTGECVPEQIKYDIERRLKRYNVKEGKPYIVSASVGIYRTDSSGNTDFEHLVRESDAAMYAEKLAKRRKI